MARWFSVLAGVILVGACGSDRTVERAANVPVILASNAGVEDTLDEQRAAELAEQYVMCVNNAGFKIDHVSVHELPGVGIFVKTEVDVPEQFHGACLTLIGGREEGLSSWGIGRGHSDQARSLTQSF
jgi:hypothetical protein